MDSQAVEAARVKVETWLVPLEGEPSGPNLEYDPDFLNLLQLVAGKPETQFSAAEPPIWTEVSAQAETLMGRTRDLRVALPWLRAQLNVEGLAALPEGLRLITGLLENHWEHLHPQLDSEDQDDSARVSALASLATLSELLGDVRQALLVQDRRIGNLRVREIEIALGRLPARSDESPRTRAQIEGLLSEQPEINRQLHERSARSKDNLLALQKLMQERLGHERSIDLKPMRQMIEAVIEILPPDQEDAALEGDDEVADEGPARHRAISRAASDPAVISSRQEAVQALDRICLYLDEHEPTNPAQMLLRRAQRLIDKDFLQLVQEFAPDALEAVARAVGIDPNTVQREE
jgi:type VI secretion system protein ImpA